MSQILSQQEIDSLLESFGTEPAQGEKGSASEAMPFSFGLPRQLGARQKNVLQSLFENFAETFATYLVGRLQCEVSVAVTAVSEKSLSDLAKNTLNPSALFSFCIEPGKMKGMMDVNPRLALATISRLLGGNGEPVEQERQLTKIEQNIFRAVAIKAITLLESTLAPIAEIRCTYDRYERDIELLPLGSPETKFLALGFEISFADQLHTFTLALPSSLIQPALDESQPATEEVQEKKPGPWSDILLQKLEKTPVTVSCLLGEAELSLRQLMELEPGDVVLTGTSIADQLEIMIGGKKRAEGRPGVVNGKKAIKIMTITESYSNE